MLEKMVAKRHGNGNITRVTASADQDSADPPPVMSRIDGMPVRTKINLEPGAEIHGLDVRWDTNIAQIPRRVTGRNIHAPAQSDCQMRKIAAHANLFAKGFQSGAIGPSLQIIKAEVAVDEVANRCYPRPSRGSVAEGLPGKIQQFA